MNLQLLARWTSPQGESNRERLLFCWRAGLPWRDRALWPGPEGDARPDLRGIDLSGERLAGVDLSDTRLDEASFDEADLSRALLRRSSLGGASFEQSVAVGVDAFAATFVGARFHRSTFARATLAAANLAAASLREVSLREADLRGATFNGAELMGCRLEGARLAHADLDGALVVGARGLVAGRHDRDEMDAVSPAFAPLLRLYLRLLHGLSHFSQKVAQGCILASARPVAEVQALVLDEDWRVAVAGAAAAVALGPRPQPRVAEALWIALERGTWAAPQLAGAAFFEDPEFAARAAVFLAPDATATFAPPSAKNAPLPAKSLVSVAALLDRNGGLPARLAALPEADATRQATLRWVEQSKWAAGRLRARDVAEIMVENMKASQADPDLELREEMSRSVIAGRVMARSGIGRRSLARGRYAEVFLTGGRKQPVVNKEAHRPVEPSSPREPLVECEVLFSAGAVAFRDPDPNEAVRCEAEALAALAPATPRPTGSGMRPNGAVYLVRPYVAGESWRAVLLRGEPIGVEPIRRLVDLLATVEESTSLGFHGDVKPDNVISTWAGDVVLIDPTSAYMRRSPNGPLERALLTGEYNPHLAPSDHAALALTLIEMLTGHQLVAEAADREARSIGPRLRESLRFSASVGADLFARRLPAIRLPSELSPALAGPAEALLLRALGLSVSGGVLEVGEPLDRIRELGAVLQGLGR